ncbi:MAG: hypothetical protein K9I85_06400 [Saprospiraceae bacterium]|nr:hypothetical protein [Saprospiraceae bacterium]
MNILKIFLLALIPFMFTACANESAPEEETPEMSAPGAAQNPISVTGTDVGNPAPAAQPAGGTVGSKQHYYCPNSCPGSGGDAGGKCATCGADYVHNDAYHLQGAGAPQTPNPQTAEPPQNAKGVWHYSCPKGCAGGAGAAGACAKCGTALAHNGQYHN